MTQKTGQNPQTMYKNLKRQYDELLQKNQNDLIKIKMREKQLNDKIAGYQKQNLQLKEQLSLLKQNMKKKGGIVKSINEGTNTQNQIKELSSKILKKDQQIEALKKTVASLLNSEDQKKESEKKIRQELSKTKNQLDEVNKSLRILKNQFNEKEEEWSNRLTTQIATKTQQIVKERSQKEISIQQNHSRLKNHHEQLSQLEKKLTQQQELSEQLQSKLKQYSSEFMLLSQRYQQLQKQKEDLVNRPCDRCKDFQQKLQLHQQMLKSVKMMLKFKQMELDKYKK